MDNAAIALPSMNVRRLIIKAAHRAPYSLSTVEVVMVSCGSDHKLNKISGLSPVQLSKAYVPVYTYRIL